MTDSKPKRYTGIISDITEMLGRLSGLMTDH